MKNKTQQTASQPASNTADDAMQPTSGAATIRVSNYPTTAVAVGVGALPHGLTTCALLSCSWQRSSGANAVIVAPVPNTKTKPTNVADDTHPAGVVALPLA